MRRGRAGGGSGRRGSQKPSGDGEGDEAGASDAYEDKAAAHKRDADPMDSEVFELKLEGQGLVDNKGGEEAEKEDEDEPDEENTSAVRRRRGSSSGRSSGRARRGGGSAGGNRDEERAQLEAEKKKVQTVLMVAVPLGLLFLIVLAVIVSGGESHPQEEAEPVEQTTVQTKDVPAAVLAQVKALLDQGRDEFKTAERLEGPAKLSKLEAAARKLSEAEDVANAQRNRVADANRGANFDQLDGYEQEVAKTRIMVRKAMQEAGGKGD